jgi:hypothetical protein
MDRVATFRLRDREPVTLPGEGVQAVPDPVGPGHQQLAAASRAAGVRRVPGQDVEPAEGASAQSTADLDHDNLVLTVPDGPLLTAGKDSHPMDDTAQPG